MRPRKPRLGVLLAAFLGCVAVLLVIRLDPAEYRLFRQHVLNPIPRSVTEIRVDHARRVSGYGYIFRFKVSSADVGVIVASRPFQKVENAKYESWGEVSFDWSLTSWSGLAVYPSGQSKPRWFTLHLWHDPEAYAYEERDEHLTTYVLLYNQAVGEAYFFAFRGDYTP